MDHDGDISSKEFNQRMKWRYEDLLCIIRPVARKSGYALAVHGTMHRDLDVVAVPWVKRAVLPKTLVERLVAAIDKAVPDGCSWVEATSTVRGVCYQITLRGFYVYDRKEKNMAGYIDLNITPKLEV